MDVSHIELQVIILRHGETDGNAQHICQGQSDYALNNNGRRAAEQTGVHFHQREWFHVYSSDLSRASEVINQLLLVSFIIDCQNYP
jgi:2,3-bisphosphoglycerate-dependent phosphoglycerate mutase